MSISLKNQFDFQKLFQICKRVLSSHVSLALDKVVCAKEYGDERYRNHDCIDGKVGGRIDGELGVETVGHVGADREIDLKSAEDNFNSRICELGHTYAKDATGNHSDGVALGK